MKHFRILSLVTICALGSFAAAQAPTPTPAETEASSIQHAPATTGPIVVKWQFKKGAGEANLMVNPDGTYLFSGHYDKERPYKDYDIVVGLKSTDGGVILFRYVGDVSHGGVQWSKQGHSVILKDDFSTFAGKHDWYGQYHFSETKAGLRREYEERERKKEERRKKEQAEARAERERIEREEAQQQAQNSGGGTSVGDVLAAIGGALFGIF